MKKINYEAFNNGLYVRENRYSTWSKNNIDEIQKFLIRASALITPKDYLPQFAFNVEEGKRSISIQYPINFLVTEIDLPKDAKMVVKTDEIKKNYWVRYFKSLYRKIQNDTEIKYFLMYLTSSMMGIRFVIQIDQFIENEDEYKSAIVKFLETLEPYGIDKKYHDLSIIKKGWLFPKLRKYFDIRGDIFNPPKDGIKIIHESNEGKKLDDGNEKTELKEHLEIVISEIEDRKIDITENYHDWLVICFALTDSFKEAGRSYFHRISCINNKKYNEVKCDKQYDACLRSTGSGITLSTLFYIARQYGINLPRGCNVNDERFWYDDSRGIKIDYDAYFKILHSRGIGRLSMKNPDDIVFIRVDRSRKLVTEITKFDISGFTVQLIDTLNIDGGLKKQIKNAFLNDSKILMPKNYAAINVIDIPFLEDDLETMYFFYQNCFVQVKKDEITTHTYEEMQGYIWESQIIQRELIPATVRVVKEKSEFCAFIKDVSRDLDHEEDHKRYLSLKTIIGYLLHRYKDPVIPKSIVFMDASLNKDTKGRSGKGIVKTGLGKMRKLVTEDGKQFDFGSKFCFSQVTIDTHILFIDDVPGNFDFEKLYSVLTEGVMVERKHKNKFHLSFEDSPKILITTNYAIQGSGDSFEGRIFEYEFCDFYKFGFTPLDKFGHRLFEQWDQVQWNLFDNFMLSCCKTYLRMGLKESTFINLPLKKVITKTGFAFVEYLSANIEFNKRYEKQTMFEDFIKENPSFKDWGRNKFTIHMKEYYKIKEMDVKEFHSGKDHYFMVVSKNNDLD